MTAAVTGAAQRLAAGRAHPWTAAAAAFCWDHLPQRHGQRVRDPLRARLPRRRRGPRARRRRARGAAPDRPARPRAAGLRRHRGRGAAAHVLTPRPGRPIRALFDPAAVDRALDAVAAGQLEDGGWDFDWLHWDEARGVRDARARDGPRGRAAARERPVAFRRIAAPPAQSEKRVEPLELFFDLVFVFALTQVTARLAARPVVGRAAARPARARIDLVGVGGVRVADQRGRQPPLAPCGSRSSAR